MRVAYTALLLLIVSSCGPSVEEQLKTLELKLEQAKQDSIKHAQETVPNDALDAIYAPKGQKYIVTQKKYGDHDYLIFANSDDIEVIHDDKVCTHCIRFNSKLNSLND